MSVHGVDSFSQGIGHPPHPLDLSISLGLRLFQPGHFLTEPADLGDFSRCHLPSLTGDEVRVEITIGDSGFPLIHLLLRDPVPVEILSLSSLTATHIRQHVILLLSRSQVLGRQSLDSH